MSKHIIGTCSICGGTVSVPTAWWGIYPPTPTCERCGATALQHGPVVPMEPRKHTEWEWVTDTSGTGGELRRKE